MPPSPNPKISELRTANPKRGRSLGRRIALDDKEDDLALFNEVKNKERDNYLLQSNCDLDDIFASRIKQSSDHKGFAIVTRGESSDLLNAVDKNDYDWLLTPPESPLFPSLDDERLHYEMRGRTRGHPVPIPQVCKVEKGSRSVRGSPSPRRPSPSPRSNNAKMQSRSRPSSASHCSPPTFPHTSPSRRLSPPPSKLATLAVRSGALTPRRMSTGSASTTQTRRGISPVKTSRGNSASPKTRAWQSDIHGFSCEAPLNLRTSLANRPGSYVRGSSPASRNSGSGRQSMSPAASRSVSSSNSHEIDPFSSYSKGSVASSRDDDIDSLPSNPVSCSDYSVPQDICALPNNRSSGVLKKPTKVFSSSAPKSFALRQLDKKGPHNMFRPLMSNVSSSTFYVGKGGTPSHALVSKNSSITTSSNANCDHGSTIRALDIDEVDEKQDDMSRNFLEQQHPGTIDEVSSMDTAAASIEDAPNMIIENPERDDSSAVLSELVVAESSSTAFLHSGVNIDGASDMEVCSRCQRRLNSAEIVTEGGEPLCQKCKILDSIPSFIPEETAMAEANSTTIDNSTRIVSLDILEHSMSVPERISISQTGATKANHFESIPHKAQNVAPSSTEEPEPCIDGVPCHEGKFLADFYLGSKFDIHELKGLSLLLKRSSGAQGHIIPNRSYTASNTSIDDFSYMRDSLTSLRSSVGHSSVSALSSFDLGSYKSNEAHAHGQLRVQNSDTENFRCGESTSHQSSISLSLEDGFELIREKKSNAGRGVAPHESPHHLSLNSENTEASTTDKGSSIICKTTDSGVSFSTSEEPSPLETGNKWSGNPQDSTQEETSTLKSKIYSPGGDTKISSNCDDADAEPQVPQPGTMENMPHILPSELDSTKSESCMNDLVEKVTAVQDAHITASCEQPHVSTTENAFLEDTTRSLALEEATDVILICSSIVHDIAYNAANIAINKESSEAGFPITIPFSSKTISDKKQIRSRTMGRCISKSYKSQKRELEMEQSSPQSVLGENEGKSTPRIVLSPASMSNSHMPPKMVSKCNCTIM